MFAKKDPFEEEHFVNVLKARIMQSRDMAHESTFRDYSLV